MHWVLLKKDVCILSTSGLFFLLPNRNKTTPFRTPPAYPLAPSSASGIGRSPSKSQLAPKISSFVTPYFSASISTSFCTSSYFFSFSVGATNFAVQQCVCRRKGNRFSSEKFLHRNEIIGAKHVSILELQRIFVGSVTHFPLNHSFLTYRSIAPNTTVDFLYIWLK